ncbi:MAG: tetratricopeptide repeat protein [Pseudomonadota bacterium]
MTKPPTIDRKTLKTPDAFVSKGTQLLSRISNSRVGLIPILVLGLLVAIGFYGYDVWEGNREEKAWSEYYEANKTQGDAKWEQLELVSKYWAQSRAAMLAAVDLADHHFENSKQEWGKDKAKVQSEAQLSANWYSKALEERSLLPVEKQLLLINKGNAEELLEKWSDSYSDYEKAFTLTGPAKALALLSMGRVQEAQGDKDKAAQTYEKVFTEFAAGEYAKVAKMNWRKLKSPLLNAGKS